MLFGWFLQLLVRQVRFELSQHCFQSRYKTEILHTRFQLSINVTTNCGNVVIQKSKKEKGKLELIS